MMSSDARMRFLRLCSMTALMSSAVVLDSSWLLCGSIMQPVVFLEGRVDEEGISCADKESTASEGMRWTVLCDLGRPPNVGGP